MDNRVTERESERLFIAVQLPQELKMALHTEVEALASRFKFAKWTHPDDYHITLQFLGDTPKDKIPALLAALKEISAKQNPFQLQLTQWGTFGLPEAPRVLWAGVSGDLERLRELQANVVSGTAGLGFKAEERAYSPHLTLARKYRGDHAFKNGQLGKISISHEGVGNNCSPKDWTVDAFVVYATRMHAIPMYEMIEKLPFF